MFSINNFVDFSPCINSNLINRQETKDKESLAISSLSLTIRSETYEDVIINLSIEEQRWLEAKMQELPNQSNFFNLLGEALTKPSLSDPIWSEPLFPLYALLALKQKKISGMTFSTSQLFYNVMNHPANKGKVQIISLYNEETINPSAWNLIQETAQPFQSQFKNEIKISSYLPFMTSKEQSALFDLMRKLPSLEQMFLLIPEPNPMTSHIREMVRQSNAGTVTEIIQSQELGFNVFGRLSNLHLKEPMRMIPSKGLMQAYILVTGGDSSFITQIGLANDKVLKQGILLNERPMSLNFSFLKKAQQADGYECLEEANEEAYHDFYHIDIFKLIKQDRPKFYGMSEALQKIAFQYPSVKGVADILDRDCIDMQHVMYSYFHLARTSLQQVPPKDALFCASISLCLELSVKKKKEHREKYPELCLLIANELIQNADFYRDHYGITLDFLLSFDQFRILDPLKSQHFHEIACLIVKTNSTLNHLLDTSDLNILLNFSKNNESYLIREGALRQLKKRLNLNTIHQFFELAKQKRAFMAQQLGMDFLAVHYKDLATNQILSVKAKDDLMDKLRNSPIFEFLLRSAVSDGDRIAFDLLMNDPELIKLNINQVFNDGMTLWQIARNHNQENMANYLAGLGAIEKN